MNRRRPLVVAMLAAMLLGSGGWATACPEGDTGAGSSQNQDPIGKAVEGDHNHSVYLEVQWEPGARPVEVSYTVNGDFHGYKVFKNSPFVLNRIQTGDAEIALHGRQKEQGFMRCAIEVDGEEKAHDATTKFEGSVDCSYKPTHARKPTA